MAKGYNKKCWWKSTFPYLYGKKVKLKRDITNKKGETIKEGEVATIADKWGGFRIETANATIKGVQYWDLIFVDKIEVNLFNKSLG